ncbi:MAG: PDZ domain-containing protein [Oligoflexia bacterium]|nr:PDZ domain-containing protein [Oligoflexia bacterium]
MRKAIMLFIPVLLMLSGCSFSTKTVNWPAESSGETWYRPAFIYSMDEAVSVLKSLPAGASINGRGISSVDVDKFTIRISQKWQETYENTEYVPSFGGFFLGWNYVPVYSGSNQTTVTTYNKENNVAVNFRDITDISINNRVLYIASSPMAVFVCSSYAEAQKYGDAFYSMMKANGLKLGASYGFSFSSMTADQEKEIKKKGAVVSVVYGGGPADKAGLRPRDVIYEVNGVTVETPEAAAKALISGGFSKAAELKVLHWEKPGGDAYTIKWEKRLVTVKPVAR